MRVQGFRVRGGDEGSGFQGVSDRCGIRVHSGCRVGSVIVSGNFGNFKLKDASKYLLKIQRGWHKTQEISGILWGPPN